MSKRQLFSVSELAPEFGVDRRTLSDRLRDTAPDGLLAGRPAYHLASVLAAVYGAGTTTKEAILQEQLRALQDQRKIREREYVKEVDVVDTFFQIVSTIRTAILGLPRKMAAMLSRCRTPEEAERLLTVEVRAILDKLAALGRTYLAQHQKEKENA